MKIRNIFKRKKKDYLEWDSSMLINNDLANKSLHKRNLIRAGFKFINRTNKYKKLIAYGLIVIGCVTLPLPTGSFILIGLGVGMLGLKKDCLKRWFKLLVYRKKAERSNKIK